MYITVKQIIFLAMCVLCIFSLIMFACIVCVTYIFLQNAGFYLRTDLYLHEEILSEYRISTPPKWFEILLFLPLVCVCVCVCVCFFGKGKGGTPHMHGHKESYKDLNLKILTSEWDSNPRPHEY